MKHLLSAAALAVALLVLAPGANAESIVYYALLSGPNEDPPNNSPGTGLSLVTLDLTANLIRIQATFEGLVAGTTVAHIHAPTAVPFAGNVGVAVQPGTLEGFPVGVTSGSYDRTFDLTNPVNYTTGFFNAGGGTAAGAAALLAQSLANGRAYFNIHSTQFPPGEIRGFLVPIPEPSGLVLATLGASGVGVLVARGRRKAEAAPGTSADA